MALERKDDRPIEDFGQKIGGAKKDLWKGRGFDLSDFESLDEREYAEFVTKQNIWPEPDFKALVEGGMTPGCAYYVKFIRDKLPAKPVSNSSEHARIYITLVTIYKTVAMGLKDIPEYAAMRAKLELEALNTDFKYLRVRPYFNVIKAVLLTEREIQRLKTEADIQGFPDDFKGALKGVTIAEYTRNGEPYYKILDGKRYGSNEDFKTYEDALAHAKGEFRDKKLERQSSTARRQSTKKLVRPQLEGIERTGKDVRKGRDIDGETLLEEFKFRGGEFGNWNTQEDRQASLNYAYEAFVDLASVLRTPKDFISLGGYKDKKLAIAFGSRGSGYAVAHYEPSNIVINLTKMKGAGSLAHEWAHALDDYLGIKCADSSMLSRVYKGIRRGVQYPEVVSAFEDLVSTMRYREATPEEMLEARNKDVEKYTRMIDSRVKSLPNFYGGTVDQSATIQGALNKFQETYKIEDFEELVKTYKEVVGRLPSKETRDDVTLLVRYRDYVLEDLENYKLTGTFSQVAKLTTNFYNASKALDGGRSKPYYSTITEMFARAFESYVEDVITKRGNKSDYLVHSTHNGCYLEGLEPYPMGKEREAINHKLKEFLLLVAETFAEVLEPEVDEVVSNEDKEERSKFKLTHFKTTCREKQLKADLRETPKEGEDYLINFLDSYIKTLRVPIFSDVDKEGHVANVLTPEGVQEYKWDNELDYEDLILKLLEIEKIGQEQIKRKVEQKANEEVEQSKDILENKEVIEEAVAEANELKNQEQQSELDLMLKAAEDLREKARLKGLRLRVDSENGTILLYYPATKEIAKKIQVDGFNPNTSFSHAKTKTGYSGQGPETIVTTKLKDGKLLAIQVDARAIEFVEKTGVFIAPKGLEYKKSLWREREKAPIAREEKGKGVQKDTPSKEFNIIIKDVKEHKDIKNILNEYVKAIKVEVPYAPVFQQALYKVQYNITVKFKKKLPILLRVIPEDKVQGNSKTWAYDTEGNLCIQKSAEERKKIEGLIEGVVEGLLPKQGYSKLQRTMLREGLTHMICKTYNLDVRTYCMSEGFDIILKAGDTSVKNYVNQCVHLYKQAIEYFI